MNEYRGWSFRRKIFYLFYLIKDDIRMLFSKEDLSYLKVYVDPNEWQWILREAKAMGTTPHGIVRFCIRFHSEWVSDPFAPEVSSDGQ